MATKEFREFFLRNTPVNSGTKKDQEVGYPTQYTILTPSGSKNVFNRFLKNHYPSEGVFRKLYESIAFKLNPEDTASDSVQGLVKIASDVDAKANQTYSDGFKRAAQPSQLPTVAADVDAEGVVWDNPFPGSTDDNFPVSPITVTVSTTVETRNHYLIKLSDSFKAWITTILTEALDYINEIEADVSVLNSTYLNHAWKTIKADFGSQFDSGEDVPDYGTAVDATIDVDYDNGSGTSFRDNTTAATGVKAKKVRVNEVAIYGQCQIPSGVVNANLWTMPVGMRPVKDTLLNAKFIYSNATGDRLECIDNTLVYIRSNGQVRISNVKTTLTDYAVGTIFFNTKYFTD